MAISSRSVLAPAGHDSRFNAGVVALVEPIRVDDDIRTVQLPITAVTVVVVLALLRRGGLHRLGGVTLVALSAAFLL
jgi:Ca2+/Na+ antiporter